MANKCLFEQLKRKVKRGPMSNFNFSESIVKWQEISKITTTVTLFHQKKWKWNSHTFILPFFSLKMFTLNLNFSGRNIMFKLVHQIFFLLRVDTDINLELCIRHYSIFFVQVGHQIIYIMHLSQWTLLNSSGQHKINRQQHNIT